MNQASPSRKTYYLVGLLGVACSMGGALAVLAGRPMVLMDNAGFVLTAFMWLLLAAIKGSPAADKRHYFLCFALCMVAGSVQLPWPFFNYLLLAAFWPLFCWYELGRGAPLQNQLRLLLFAEGVCLLFRTVAGPLGLSGFALFANLFWLLDTVARGWLMMTLYGREKVQG